MRAGYNSSTMNPAPPATSAEVFRDFVRGTREKRTPGTRIINARPRRAGKRARPGILRAASRNREDSSYKGIKPDGPGTAISPVCTHTHRRAQRPDTICDPQISLLKYTGGTMNERRPAPRRAAPLGENTQSDATMLKVFDTADPAANRCTGDSRNSEPTRRTRTFDV